MHDPADSLLLDENLARLLAAFDQSIEGGDEQAPTINVRPSAVAGDRRGENQQQPAESADGEPPEKMAPIRAPKSGKFLLVGGPHRVGRFELRRQLGKGGCGIVFLAYDPKLEREVALKIPRPEMMLSPDARRRLVREALAAAEFDHPNLVPVYETGEIGPICFIATAFCPGQTLGEWLDKQAFPVPVRQAGRLVATVAEAVQHAHDRGVLHRDLKPNNVILQATKEDPNELEPPPGSVQLRGDNVIPRVVDFGLAKLVERGGPSETTTRQILGTPKYMAPEQAQARHEDVGPAADVYALGVILYEMITGRAPYEGATDVEVLRLAIDGNLTQPRHLRPDVPRDLEAICLKAMHRNPAHRYRTAIDLSDDLRRFLDDKPTLARPLKWPGRAARWLRRNDQAVALGVVTTIASILLAVGSWSLQQTRQMKSDRDSVLRTQAERTRGDQQLNYAKNVRSAFLAWRAGDRKAAAEYLDAASRLARMGGEFPDFAHGYLSRLVAADRRMIVCSAGPVTALGVSRDGKRIASGHADGTVAVWDRATGEELGSLKAYDESVRQVAFALDDSRLVTVGGPTTDDEAGRVWNLSATGALGTDPEASRSLGKGVRRIAVSPEGGVVYVGTATGRLHERHLADPAKDRELRALGDDPVTALQAEGSTLYVGTSRGRAIRMSIPPEPADWEDQYPQPVTAILDRLVSLRPNDWRLPTSHGVASGGGPGWVGIGRESLVTGDSGEVRAAAVTRDGNTLFTAGDDGVIRAWEVPTDFGVRPLPVAKADGLAIHTAGRAFAVRGGRVTELFGVGAGGAAGKAIPTPGRGYAALRFANEAPVERASMLGVELRDNAAVVLETKAGLAVEFARFTPPDGATATSADLTPDCAVLAAGDNRGRLFLWDVVEKRVIDQFECGHQRPILRVSVADDGNSVAAPAPDGIGVWMVKRPLPAAVVPAEDQNLFRLFPFGDRLATAGRSGVVRVWSVPGGREELTLHGHVGRVTGLGVSPSGRTLVSGGADGEAKLWDTRTGLELFGIRRHTGPVTTIEFSGNGRLMVTAGAQVGVWETWSE